MFQNIHNNSIWLDENLQAVMSANPMDLIDLAALQQQPPLHYAFMSPIHQIFGFNEISTRITSVIFATGSLLLLFLILEQLNVNAILKFALTFYLLFNPAFMAFSVEGRPYTLLLFTEMLLLLTIIEHLKAEDSHDTFLALICTSFLCLISIGFQPVILCSTLVGLSLLLFVVTRNRRLLGIASANFLAILMVLPLYFKIWLYSVSAFINKSSPSSESLFTFIKEELFIASKLFISFDYKINSEIFDLGFVFVAIFSIFLIAALHFKKVQVRTSIPLFLLLCLLYPITLCAAYAAIVKWPFSSRYAISIMPIVLICVAICIEFFQKKKRLIFSCLFMMFAIYKLTLANPEALLPYQAGSFTHWRELYAHLAQKTDNSSAYLLNFNKEGIWTEEGFVAQDYYQPKNLKTHAYSSLSTQSNSLDPNLLKKKFNSVDFIMRDVEDSDNPDFIYFIQNTRISFFDIKKILNSNEKYEKFEEFEIIEIRNTQGFLKTLLDFYKRIEKMSEKKYEYRNVFFALFRLNLIQNDCAEAKKYLSISQNYLKKHENFLYTSLYEDKCRKN